MGQNGLTKTGVNEGLKRHSWSGFALNDLTAVEFADFVDILCVYGMEI